MIREALRAMAVGDPFVLDGAGPRRAARHRELAALVLHGFTGTPYEVRYLGERLAAAGITAVGPRLPGHGTSVADLAHTTWQDWAGAVERELDALRARAPRVVVVGQSLGALLALELASRRGADIAAVCALAAPLWLDGLAARVARWTAPGRLLARLGSIPKFGGSDVRDPRAKADNPAYRAIPLAALAQLTAFMEVANAALPRVTPPVLVLHGQQDHTAPVACASRIAARVPRAELRVFPASYHLLAADVEREAVASAVIDFVQREKESACAT